MGRDVLRARELFLLVLVICGITEFVKSRPLTTPDFESDWRRISASKGKDLIRFYHGFGEVPMFVVVQGKSTNEADSFIYHGIGVVPRDDDSDDKYGYISYIYNEQEVLVGTPSASNNVAGYSIYADNNEYWEGPAKALHNESFVRVLAWRSSSFPPPDLRVKDVKIVSACINTFSPCYVEREHKFSEYPSFVIVRTELDTDSTTLNGNFSDAVGAGLMTYQNMQYRRNGYVLFGYDQQSVRIWIDSSPTALLFRGADGGAFSYTTTKGSLEIIMWKLATLRPTHVEYMQLGTEAGETFDSQVKIKGVSQDDSILMMLSATSLDGVNTNFRFPGSGSMSVATKADTLCNQATCQYGGLTYAYTNKFLRIWKPINFPSGSIISIPHYFGKGENTQRSQNASAVVNIWKLTKTTLNKTCYTDNDCIDQNSACIAGYCRCAIGFYEVWKRCEKDLTCDDVVPEIPNLGLRPRNNLMRATGEHPLDDSKLKHSWYSSANANGAYIMPDRNTPPGDKACGTDNQLYANGTHPDIGMLNDTQTFIACDQTCTVEYTIQVRKCSDGKIHYNLPQVQQGHAAFCFDPPDIQGVRDFEKEPDIKTWGKFEVKAELQFREFDNNQHHNFDPFIKFTCANDSKYDDGLMFTTYWSINDNVRFTLGPSRTIEPLYERMLIDNNIQMGFHVKCGVSASLSETGLLSEKHTSEDLFCGIKVLTSTLLIEKGKSAVVSVQPTCPIGCLYSNTSTNSSNCSHTLRMMYPEHNGCSLNKLLSESGSARCGTSFKTLTKEDEWHANQVYNFTVTTKDQNYNDARVFKLAMKMEDFKHTIWNSYETELIQVYVTKAENYKHKICYAHVDPHMKTGDDYFYEHQYDGEFIFYKNTKYGTEVQMKTTSCNQGRAWCACAVAVRAGGDVFLVNLCGKLRFIGFTSCDDGGILDVRERTSHKYQIVSPIGTIIELTVGPHPGYMNLINIDTYLAAKDLGNTEGLCGNVDNDQINDLKGRKEGTFHKLSTSSGAHHHPGFSEEWRIKRYDKNYLLLNPGHVPEWSEAGLDMFCFCDSAVKANRGNIPDHTVKEANCSASLYQDCPASRYSVSKSLCDKHRGRRRRSSDSYFMELQRRQQLVHIVDEVPGRSRRAINTNISDAEANHMCSSSIIGSSFATQLGHRLKGINPNQAVSECSFDVSASGDTGWCESYVETMKNVIQMNNEKDPEYVDDHPAEVSGFEAQSCLRNCNNRGECTNGTCICEDGFHGPDCGINEKDRIEIDDIQGGGVCDLDIEEDCDCIHVQTSNLLKRFYCNIKETRTLLNGTKLVDDPDISSGHFEDIFNGVCCFKTRERRSVEDDKNKTLARRLDIALSNNGLVFGHGVPVFIYQGTCLYKTQEGYIHVKDAWCFIGGTCVSENATDPEDNCKLCQPQEKLFSWVNNCDVISNEVPQWPISMTVLAVLVSVGCAVVATVSFLVIRNKLKKKERVAEAFVFDKVQPMRVASKYKSPSIKEFETHIHE